MVGQPLGVDAVTEQLRALGVRPGQLLQVHTAFSKVGPVEGGPLGLIAALRAALGDSGTLVMTSMSNDDDHLFDPRSTPCPHMGIVAETFWRLPGVLRSDNGCGATSCCWAWTTLPTPQSTLPSTWLASGTGGRSTSPCYGTACPRGSSTMRSTIAADGSRWSTAG